MDVGYGTRDEPRRALYVLLAGAEGGGPTAQAARQAREEELAGFLCKIQGEVIQETRGLLARRVAEQEKARKHRERDRYRRSRSEEEVRVSGEDATDLGWLLLASPRTVARDLLAGIRQGRGKKECLAVGELFRCVLLHRCLLFLEDGVKGITSVRPLPSPLMRPVPAGGHGAKRAVVKVFV